MLIRVPLGLLRTRPKTAVVTLYADIPSLHERLIDRMNATGCTIITCKFRTNGDCEDRKERSPEGRSSHPFPRPLIGGKHSRSDAANKASASRSTQT